MVRYLNLVLTVALCSGCAELTLFSFATRPRSLEASAKHPVMELICLWEPAEGQGLDGLPTRGFAGQLLFFTNGRPQPLKVRGDVRIYVFDDHGAPEEQARPIHQFDFSAEAWNNFLRETNVGAAYQVFIPYTRKTTYQTNCSLRVRYTPADGGPAVFSKMATVTLPGRVRPAEKRSEPDPLKTLLPEGSSVRAPEGGPARTESAPVMSLPLHGSPGLMERLSQLQSAAAAAAQSLPADDAELEAR